MLAHRAASFHNRHTSSRISVADFVAHRLRSTANGRTILRSRIRTCLHDATEYWDIGLLELCKRVRPGTDYLGHVSILRIAYTDYRTNSCREQVCQIFPRLRGSEYRSVLLVHQTHCSTAKNGLTVMEEWLEREDSTTIKLKLLDLFYESRKCEDLALVISAMLIIWNDRATSENSAVTSRVEGLVSCFTAPGPPDIQIFFHQLATSFRLALDVSDNHPNHVSIVSWLLDVEVEDQHHEVPEDLNEYCLGRLIGWTHAKALESTP